MNERDELAFSRILREKYKDVWFLEDDYRSHYSKMNIVPSIAHAKTRRVRMVIPSPGQEARMKLNYDTGMIMIEPECRIQFDRSTWETPKFPEKKWAFDWPILGWGDFAVSYPRDDEVNKKFAHQVFRSVNKILHKKMFGFDACRYCLEGGPRRALGGGQRPDEDWVFPLSSYYDDSKWDDRLPDKVVRPEVAG